MRMIRCDSLDREKVITCHKWKREGEKSDFQKKKAWRMLTIRWGQKSILQPKGFMGRVFFLGGGGGGDRIMGRDDIG